MGCFRVREGSPVGGYRGGVSKHYCGNLIFGKKGKLLCEEKDIFGLRPLVLSLLRFTGKLAFSFCRQN